MINSASLLFSLAAVVFVVIRAVKLDKELPWFRAQAAKQKKELNPNGFKRRP